MACAYIGYLLNRPDRGPDDFEGLFLFCIAPLIVLGGVCAGVGSLFGFRWKGLGIGVAIGVLPIAVTIVVSLLIHGAFTALREILM